MFNLDAFVAGEAAQAQADAVKDLMATASFRHERRHNIYFKKTVEGLAPDHPALREFDTSNNTLCADQLAGSLVEQIYALPELTAFLAEVMDKPALYPMDDPLASFNVMQYRDGPGPELALRPLRIHRDAVASSPGRRWRLRVPHRFAHR